MDLNNFISTYMSKVMFEGICRICFKKLKILFHLQRKISACPKTAKVRKKAQKGVKRRKKATSWRKKAHAWRQKASIGAFWRLLTPFGELEKIIVFCNYFLIFFFIFIKRIKKVCFCSLNFLCFNLFVEFITIYSKKFLILK